MEFVEIITYYPSVSYADISPRKGRLVIKTPLLHIILYFKLTHKPEFILRKNALFDIIRKKQGREKMKLLALEQAGNIKI